MVQNDIEHSKEMYGGGVGREERAKQNPETCCRVFMGRGGETVTPTPGCGDAEHLYLCNFVKKAWGPPAHTFGFHGGLNGYVGGEKRE